MFEFAGVNYYNYKHYNRIRLKVQKDGAFVNSKETTSELNLNDYFAENNMTYKPIYVE